MYIKTLSVTAINNYIKKMMDADFILSNASIKGEISNFKLHTSGHAYFSLKDDNSKIRCVMFNNNVSNLTFMPQDGMEVIVKGRISIYKKEGSYQLYCEEIKLDGVGDLYKSYLKLKEKLDKEGLFDVEHKKSIPVFPRRIGVVTSPTGAAVRDIINVSKSRNNTIDIIIYPALVQGVESSKNLISGIEFFNKCPDIDVIILARGGGSLEELWSFNDENLAYAVYNSSKPVVTGVGHETDFTIVDFVSDKRASTPSQAAEIVIPQLREIESEIKYYYSKLFNYMNYYLSNKKSEIEMLKKGIEYNNPLNNIVNQYNYIDNMKEKLEINLLNKIYYEKETLNTIKLLLNSHNPTNILNKGYAILKDKNGNTINDINVLLASNEANITLKNGSVNAKLKFIDK